MSNEGTRRSAPISFRRIGREHSAQGVVLTVFCPREARVLDVSECRACEDCHGLSLDMSDGDSFLRCRYTSEPQAWTRGDGDPAIADEASVSELMTTPVHTVTKHVTANEVLRVLMEKGLSALPVVNEAGHAIGIVSKTDLLREHLRAHVDDDGRDEDGALDAMLDNDVLSTLTAGALMTPFAFSLPFDSPVSLAAALMSYEAVHRIIITDSAGGLVGMLSSLDVLRWLAERRGFTIPPRRRRQAV
jgi:CBS domain-containing protein